MIKVRSKTLFISGEEQSIAAVGEAETTVREFSIDRLSGDGIDLANLIFKLNIRYVGTKQSDRSDLEKIVTDDSIILRWLVSSVTLSHPGTAFIQLDAFDREGSCRWKSYQAAVYIEKSLDSVVVSRSTLSELEQLEKKFETIGVGEAARVEAEKKRIVAEEKREEAEEKRNQSLANIVSEEEKIKAISEEAKGYRDSIKEDKEAVSRDKKDVVSVRSEVISAMNTAQQYASSAESSKAEATTARNEAVNAKTEANNAKNEAISAKNAANSIKGEVQALKNEANSTVDRAKQNADRAETFANNAKLSEGKVEGFKTEASVSAQKAKDSEAKTLEALKKAEASGKVSITKEEMKTYVDSAVGNVKSGITEAEATTLARKVANDSITSRFADGKGTIESDVKKWSQDPSADLSIDGTSIIPGYFFKNSLSGFRAGMWDIHAKGLMEMRKYVSGEIGKVQTGVPEETMRSYVAGEIGKVKTGAGLTEEQEKLLKLVELEKQPERNIAELLGYPINSSGQYVLAGLQIAMRKGEYGHIRPGDYFYYDWEQKNRKLKFKVLGVNPYSIGMRHIDFICLDERNTSAFMDMEKLKTFTRTGRWKTASIINEWNKEFIADNASLMRFIYTKYINDAGQMKIWAPTKCEVFGKSYYEDKVAPYSDEFFQYPLFAKSQDERVCIKENKSSIGFVLLDAQPGGRQALTSYYGTNFSAEYENVFTKEQKKNEYCIPICFRVALPG
jgi:merozoite surface protein 3 (MSP3), putative